MKLKVLIILLFFCIVISCEKDDSFIGFEPGPSGSFNYQSYDSLGFLIVIGWLKFEHTDSVMIEGSWQLNNINNRNDIGPQFGQGELIGSITDSQIWMELNPQFVDHNMHLEGTINDKIIEGKWYWISIRGVTNWGTFKASKT